MAGTVVKTEETHSSIKRIAFDWLSSAAGAADATTTAILDGQLIGVMAIPDSGATTPSDQYDLTLKDADGYDLLFGQGANLSSTNSVAILSGLGQITNDALVLGITNGGNAKGGIVVVFIR